MGNRGRLSRLTMLGPQDLASFGSREYSAAPCRERSRSGACCGTGQERAASRSLRWWHAGRQRVSPVRQRGTLLQAKLTRKTRRIPSGMKGRSRVSPVHGLQKDNPATFADMFPTLSLGIALANECSSFPDFSSWHTPARRFELSWPSPFAAKESSRGGR